MAMSCSKTQKRELKKRELVDSALLTLAKLGYARASLRDIAKQCGVSVGVIHYYFEDKDELIKHCVLIYKEQFLDKIQRVVTEAATYDELIEGFFDQLVTAVADDAESHRLWYDIRSQALFEPALQTIVADIENAMIAQLQEVLQRINALGKDTGKVNHLNFYLLLESHFRYWLQKKLCEGDMEAPAKMKQALYASVCWD